MRPMTEVEGILSRTLSGLAEADFRDEATMRWLDHSLEYWLTVNLAGNRIDAERFLSCGAHREGLGRALDLIEQIERGE